MVMRWLIRGVCLLLLAGVVGVWVGSYAGFLGMYKYSPRYYLVAAVQGLVYMHRSGDRVHPPTPLRFYFNPRATGVPLMPPRTLGYYAGRDPTEPGKWIITFPLWLPTLLLVVLNGFVWRWTRRRKVGVVGFPVEPANKAGK